MKLLILLLITSCAQVTSLNLKKHSFGILPTKIIWFQVAGLEEEQIAMLRFDKSAQNRTSFEKNTCMGKTWSYNLFDLRPKGQSSFLSELTGKNNIKLNCEDTEHRPIWSYLGPNGYNTGILEIGANKEQSLMSLNQCGENGLVFLSSLYFWSRSEPTPGSATFHYNDPVPMEPNQFVYDRACTGKVCRSTIYDDVKAVYDRFRYVSKKHMIIVRDFSYLESLEKKDMVKAKEILKDLERSYDYALKVSEDFSDVLVLFTTADGRYIDLPAQGKDWYEFEKKGSGAQVKSQPRLTNLVLATGARAENFCGIYESQEVFTRILTGPKQQGLELKVINPFK